MPRATWTSGIDANPTREMVRDMMASGMYGGPPIHRSHPDAIVVATDPIEYECPACKARGTELANPCSSSTTIPV